MWYVRMHEGHAGRAVVGWMPGEGEWRVYVEAACPCVCTMRVSCGLCTVLKLVE